ncbi:Wzz/FepE/Etk N-terminal domain-containing protein [Viridibacillus arvi]|uniref:Wzz/FepE/Etk N-terminal domain-containing protein n=1 Tax=Viridibacillus arvi TaxID=263475 RepID=UPI0034CF05A3
MNKEITIYELWYLVVRYKWKMLIFTLLGLILGAGICFNIPQKYEARTDLLIKPITTNSNQPLTSSEIDTTLRLMNTYKELLSSNLMLDLLNEKLDKKMSKSDFMNNISIVSEENSQIISIVVMENQPQRATIIANTFATLFKEQIGVLFHLNNIQLLHNAALGEAPNIVSQYSLYSGIGALFGLFISLILIFIREVYKPKLDGQKKLEHVEQTYLSDVPRMKWWWKPERKREVLADHIHFVGSILEIHLRSSNTKTFVVTSNGKKEGKTLIATELAKHFANDNKKTIYVDANLRQGANTTSLCARSLTKGLAHYLAEDIELEEITQPTVNQYLQVICAGQHIKNPIASFSSKKMSNTIEKLEQIYDVVIIDTASLQVSDALILTKIVDGYVYVANTRKTFVRQASIDFEKLKNLQGRLIGVVLNEA